MRIVKIQRVVQSARILPIHVKEGDIRGKSTSFYILVSGRPRSRELRDLVSFKLDKTGPRLHELDHTPMPQTVHTVTMTVSEFMDQVKTTHQCPKLCTLSP